MFFADPVAAFRNIGRALRPGGRAAKGGADAELIPLPVPEVRRLLRLLTEPPERHGFLLRWSQWRRAHEAVARRGHVAARARARPVASSPPSSSSPGPDDRPPPAELTNAQWARVRPLLPPRAPVGRPLQYRCRTRLGVFELPGAFWEPTHGKGAAEAAPLGWLMGDLMARVAGRCSVPGLQPLLHLFDLPLLVGNDGSRQLLDLRSLGP